MHRAIRGPTASVRPVVLTGEEAILWGQEVDTLDPLAVGEGIPVLLAVAVGEVEAADTGETQRQFRNGKEELRCMVAESDILLL